jgi:hypothetical protein
MGKIKDAVEKAKETGKFLTESDPRLVGKDKDDWRKTRKELGKDK